MFEAFTKERTRNANERTEAYLIGRRDEKLAKEDQRMVVPLLLCCTSSATTVQKVEDSKGWKL